jgi:hypothetical protein
MHPTDIYNPPAIPAQNLTRLLYFSSFILAMWSIMPPRCLVGASFTSSMILNSEELASNVRGRDPQSRYGQPRKVSGCDSAARAASDDGWPSSGYAVVAHSVTHTGQCEKGQTHEALSDLCARDRDR